MLQRITVYFMPLKLRRRHKEDDRKVGGRRQGLGYRIAKIMCSLRVVTSFQRCVNLDAEEQWTGLV